MGHEDFPVMATCSGPRPQWRFRLRRGAFNSEGLERRIHHRRGELLRSAGLSDFWAVRIDDGGGLVWDYRYGGPEDDSAEGVIETADGEYLLCGYTKSYGSGGYDFGMLRLTGETAAGPSGESFTWWGYSDTDEFSYDFTMKDANGFVFAGDQMFTETVTDESGSYTVTRRHAKVVSFIGGLVNEDFEKTLRAGSTETFEGCPGTSSGRYATPLMADISAPDGRAPRDREI